MIIECIVSIIHISVTVVVMQNLSVYKQLITKNHDFQKLFAARLITLGGDWLLTVPLLGIIYELTENPFITSLVLVVQSAPLFIFGSFGGYLADRYDRKIIISISEFVSGMVVVLILYAVNTENVAFILFSFSLLSVANSAYMPTSDAALPNVVSRENLAEANVLFFSSWGIMAGIGAGLGGFLTTVFSREVLFTVDFLSFFVSAILVFNIKKDLSEKNEVTNSIKQEVKFKDGINFVRNNNAIFYLIITKATFAISASGLLSLFTILSYDVYNTGDYGTGLMFGARGIGALIGPIIIRYFFGNTDGKLIKAIGPCIMAWGLCYFFIPLSSSLYITVFLLILAHSGGGCQWAFSAYGLQILTPDHLRGRISGMDYSFVFLSNTLSTLLMGFLATKFDVLLLFTIFPLTGLAFGFMWYVKTKSTWDKLHT